MCLLGPAMAQPPVGPSAAAEVEARFQQSYPGWMAEVDAIVVKYTQFGHILTGRFLASDAMKEIAALGAPALPYLVDRALQETPSRKEFCELAVGVIVKHRGHWGAPTLAAWWQDGRKRSADGYAVLLAQWEAALKASGEGREVVLWTTQTAYRIDLDGVYTHPANVTPAGEAYRGLEGMGIAVLPYLVERMRTGHYEFLDIADGLTDGKAQVPDAGSPPRARGQAFLAWWEQNQQDWLIPWPDTPAPEEPTAQP